MSLTTAPPPDHLKNVWFTVGDCEPGNQHLMLLSDGGPTLGHYGEDIACLLGPMEPLNVEMYAICKITPNIKNLIFAQYMKKSFFR